MPKKPSPPPCAIGGRLWKMHTDNDMGFDASISLMFTDPLGCLVPGKPTYPINTWVLASGVFDQQSRRAKNLG